MVLSKRLKSALSKRSGMLLAGAALAVLASSFAGHKVQADSEIASPGGPPTVRRLNEEQYKRSIAQIFGADIAVPGRFEPPVREDGMLAIGESKVVVTPTGLEQYATRAKEISSTVLNDAHRAKFLTCAPVAGSFDDACANQFLTKYGRLLFRRPLTSRELSAVMGLSRKSAATTDSFTKGLSAGLASLLVSPSFIFRIETVEADSSRPGGQRLDAWSLASRISFLIWNAPPDEELLNAAASGALRSPAGLKQQIDRLMASDKFVDGTRAFFSDMLAYDQFSGLSKDNAIFPIFNPQLRNDAQEQSLRTIVDHLLVQNADYRDLFTTKKTFLTRSLGALYNVRVDYRGFNGGWMPYTFPAKDPHSGVLTLPAFLMLDPSHEGRSSPTIRGKSIRENLLCQPVPMPPANVNFNIVQNTNDPVLKTARMRLTTHQENPVCAGCHKITDPIGLSLESYDPVGKFRVQENGVTIDASGKFDGKPYANSTELMQLMHDSPSTTSCVVQRTFEYGVGRKPTSGEEAWLEQLGSRFAADKYRYRALIRNLASSPAFQAIAPETVAVN